jgi:hypothetical protein
MARKAKPLHSWFVYRIRRTPAQFIGLMYAPDEKAAIREAIKEFEITDPEHQKRLMVVRQG